MQSSGRWLAQRCPWTPFENWKKNTVATEICIQKKRQKNTMRFFCPLQKSSKIHRSLFIPKISKSPPTLPHLLCFNAFKNIKYWDFFLHYFLGSVQTSPKIHLPYYIFYVSMRSKTLKIEISSRTIFLVHSKNLQKSTYPTTFFMFQCAQKH